MFEDVTTLATATRRDARRRTRLAVAVYAVCLVALLALGSYLAPAGSVDEPGDAPTNGSFRTR